MNKIRRISRKGNTTVFKLDEREYAGIGIQADTLKSLTDELNEAIEEIHAKEYLEAIEILKCVEKDFRKILNYYEEIVLENNLTLPYLK